MNSDNNTMSLIPKCNAGIDIKRRVMALEKSDELQWIDIGKLRSHLPAWGVAIISLLTLLLGFSLAWAVK